MSATPKLRGGTRSQLTRLKRLWLAMDESARDFWRSRLASDATQAQLRDELRRELEIKLVADKQLTAFRHWLDQQDLRDAEEQFAEQDEQELSAQGLAGEALRAVLLDRIKRRALKSGDFKLGLAAVDRDLKSQQVGLDREKVELMRRKADAYDRAQAALTEAKNSKGGITPETLRKIESELKLL